MIIVKKVKEKAVNKKVILMFKIIIRKETNAEDAAATILISRPKKIIMVTIGSYVRVLRRIKTLILMYVMRYGIIPSVIIKIVMVHITTVRVI